MKKSEILESIIKLAQENKLDKNAPDKAKKKLENNPRWDSTSAEEISKLYNVKPEMHKDFKYKGNISEVAHKEPVVISPAYDKINGLVENLNERQNIMLNIVNRNPTGQYYKKYAQHDLILTLVKIANDLDNRNIENLRLLADTCVLQLSDNLIVKKAALPLMLYVIPSLLGALYVQQHLSFVNEGFETNHQKLISEIDDLINSNSNFGVGYSYKKDFITNLNTLKSQLLSFYNVYKKTEPVISNLEKPKTAQELLKISQEPQADSVVKSYNALKSYAANLLPILIQVQKQFSSEDYKNRQIEEKGMLSSLVDKTQILHGGKGLVGDDFDDVARAIPPYLSSIKDLINLFNNAGSIQQKAQSDLQEAASKSEELLGNEPPKQEDGLDSLEKEITNTLLT